MNSTVLFLLASLATPPDTTTFVFFDSKDRTRIPEVVFQVYINGVSYFPTVVTCDKNGQYKAERFPKDVSEVLIQPKKPGYSSNAVRSYRDEHGVFQVPLRRSAIPAVLPKQLDSCPPCSCFVIESQPYNYCGTCSPIPPMPGYYPMPTVPPPVYYSPHYRWPHYGGPWGY